MNALRAFLAGRPALSLLLIAAVLSVRAIVPAGFMPSETTRGFAVMLCADQGSDAIRVVVPVDGPASPQDDPGNHAKDQPCAFGGLAAASAGGADAVQLAAQVVHIAALGLAPVRYPLIERFSRLRPPLRAPPHLS